MIIRQEHTLHLSEINSRVSERQKMRRNQEKLMKTQLWVCAGGNAHLVAVHHQDNQGARPLVRFKGDFSEFTGVGLCPKFPGAH